MDLSDLKYVDGRQFLLSLVEQCEREIAETIIHGREPDPATLKNRDLFAAQLEALNTPSDPVAEARAQITAIHEQNQATVTAAIELVKADAITPADAAAIIGVPVDQIEAKT